MNNRKTVENPRYSDREMNINDLPFLKDKKRLTEQPTLATKHYCKVHGNYVSRYFKIPEMGKHKSFWIENTKCDPCIIAAEDTQVKSSSDICVENGLLFRKNTRLNIGIPDRYLWWGFDKFECKTDEQEAARRSVMKFSKLVPSKFNMMMNGGNGTGKTMIACALIDSLCDKYLCKITTLSQMIRKIKSTWNGNTNLSEQHIIDTYVMYDLLVIDEVDKQFFSKTEQLFLFEVINGRYNTLKSTVIISNNGVDSAEKSLGLASMDRLDENLEVVWFKWASLRRDKVK